jgi:hypothetical protein
MVVTKRQLRRIVQEAVRRKLDAVGPNARVRIPNPVKLEGRLTRQQLQGLIDEEFALALAMRFPVGEGYDTEDRQERLHRDLDDDDEEGESAEHRMAVIGHQDEMTSYLDEERTTSNMHRFDIHYGTCQICDKKINLDAEGNVQMHRLQGNTCLGSGNEPQETVALDREMVA